MRIITKANKGDYPGYAEMYMKLLPDDGLVLKHLRDNFYKVKDLFTLYAREIIMQVCKG